MGAQLVDSVREVMFVAADESVLLTLCNGRCIEVWGDGFMQEARRTESGELLEISESII